MKAYKGHKGETMKTKLQNLITENCVKQTTGCVSGRIGTIEMGGIKYEVNYIDNGTVQEVLSTGFGKAPASIWESMLEKLEAAGGKFHPATR